MTADDLQENRRVCKFPCTSRGEGPAFGRQLRRAGASGGSAPRLQPVQGAGSRPQAPAAQQRGAPCPGEARAACGRPRLLHIFPQTQQPRLSPAPPSAGSCVGAGASGGSASRLQPVQGAGSRPQAPRCAAAGGAPAGRPARAKPGRPAAVFSPCTGRPKGEKPYPLAPSSSGCSCSPRRAASSAAPVSESSAQRLVGFFRGSSCPKGTK